MAQKEKCLFFWTAMFLFQAALSRQVAERKAEKQTEEQTEGKTEKTDAQITPLEPPSDFRKFSEIENWNPIWTEKYAEKLCVAKEKIHGTNLQWVIDLVDDKPRIRAGKRSTYLAEEDKFYEWQEMREKLRQVLIDSLWEVAASFKFNPRESKLRVYGELYGGEMPGFPPPKTAPVQRRIFYTPNKKWRAFAAEIQCGQEFVNLAWKDMCAISEKTGLPLVPVYASGKLTDFDVPDLIRHPIPVEIEKEDLPRLPGNYSEGVVFEFIDRDRALFERVRKRPIMFKYKNPEFEERATGKTKDQRLNKHRREILEKKKGKDYLISEIAPYVQYNRVENYMTKILATQVHDNKYLGSHINGILSDAAQDYMKDKHVSLTAKQIGSLGTGLGRIAKELILKWRETRRVE